MRDDRYPIAVFVIAVFILGCLTGAVITDHAWKTETNQKQEAPTP
ncbi:hypothetical protein KGG77_gp26 [Streptomyces phage Omar]|uniref:Lipoprotein n=1 Tax=Streptomyces phage Omar TaxID=2059882 RepID=A0A2H5BLQ8_9CAUD|nr:hypothetical protein KGG77_gp26 [Streptomyces phage Omar]AUG87242.1 hypothetical protein SEA_OMAR_58 [Streptomyces phage Omar]